MPAVVLLVTGCSGGGAPNPPGAQSPPPASSAQSTAAPPASQAAPPETSAGPTPPPAPAAEPAPPPAALSDLELAGLQSLPVGDLPGWKQVFTEDFTLSDVPIGAFPGPAYQARWSAGYKDGTPDTAGQASGGQSGYYPSKVLSVSNGTLDWFMHSENGVFMGAAPTPRIPNASTAPPRANSLLYGRVSVRFRADSLAGYKTAWLFWPDSGVWPRDGEIDFPEGDLADYIYGASHWADPDPAAADVFFSKSRFPSWHIATTEWTEGRVAFFLDGQLLGAGITRTPNTPMHYILQTEACLPACPAPQTQGHVQLDWIALWSRV
ncbi:glycoside hydrolase family 16 protein [Arthrobacter sp. UKPF54-2]|uniref:glycoside hydrolase family 16 protein n=1 Tax=Arthrobacter sp. UKPF54-2 TaxID=2600159 RepID=UPI0021BDE662|nr:glycoside hydrolase family 16 protein [Arthrobacter sp. UKPF54-2]